MYQSTRDSYSQNSRGVGALTFVLTTTGIVKILVFDRYEGWTRINIRYIYSQNPRGVGALTAATTATFKLSLTSERTYFSLRQVREMYQI